MSIPSMRNRRDQGICQDIPWLLQSPSEVRRLKGLLKHEIAVGKLRLFVAVRAFLVVVFVAICIDGLRSSSSCGG